MTERIEKVLNKYLRHAGDAMLLDVVAKESGDSHNDIIEYCENPDTPFELAKTLERTVIERVEEPEIKNLFSGLTFPNILARMYVRS